MLQPQAAALFGALSEAAILVDRAGTIECSNRAAARLLGDGLNGRSLVSLLASETGPFELYLQRCFGSGQALIGRVHLTSIDRVVQMQCKGSRVSIDGDALSLLRFVDLGDSQFAALTRTIAEQKHELKKRMRSEAMLKEALEERKLLLRELEHRVKNNMQMLSALLSGAEREAESVEAKTALKEASQRFSAVGAVQQLLYRSETLTTISSHALVSTLVGALSTMSIEPIETDISVEPHDLPIERAVTIGLILNELLTNAVKYGRPASGMQKVKVDFARKGSQLALIVHDNGPGFDLVETRKRSSGIGLVRGLLRQLSGSLRIERNDGCRCIVNFTEPAV